MDINSVPDLELNRIIDDIQSHPSGLGSKALDFLNKLVYFDLANGIEEELCILIITRWSAHSELSTSINEKQTAMDVLEILRNGNIIRAVTAKDSDSAITFQMAIDLQQRVLARSGQDLSCIIDVGHIFSRIWMDINSVHAYIVHFFHIHKCLKELNWPGETITFSVNFIVRLFDYEFEEAKVLEVLQDIERYFNQFSKSELMNSSHWFALQLIRIHKDTIMKSRKLLQSSDTVCVSGVNGTAENIRLDNYGCWILNQIRVLSDSGLDCHALILVAEATFDRLQKHARLCSQPDEESLRWIIAYNGRAWHSLNCFAALACFGSNDGWLKKLCRAYIRKLSDDVQCSEKSEYSLRSAYLSWVCLRDLVKKSRIGDEMISCLTEDEGLHFLIINFEKCAGTFESKEYFLKYQAQTVIETLAPLIATGKSQNVAKLLDRPEFWSFIHLILTKHPFIDERYNLDYENDLLCACEIYLDLLSSVCNRNLDAIDSGRLSVYFGEDYIKTLAKIFADASEISEQRQRHTCLYYLFTIVFTLFDNLKANEVIGIYLSTQEIDKAIEEFSSENATFQVPDGCLREYRRYVREFIDFYKDELTPRVIGLARNILKVPEKYDWETDIA